MPRWGCQGKPLRYSSGLSLRKSSRRRNGSKSEVLPKPKARLKWTPAPSRVGLDFIKRVTGRMDTGLLSSEIIILGAGEGQERGWKIRMTRFEIRINDEARMTKLSMRHQCRAGVPDPPGEKKEAPGLRAPLELGWRGLAEEAGEDARDSGEEV